jgi:hypothetical protein
MGQQFTVRLKNEPGALAALAEAFAEQNIDIRTIGAGGIGTVGLAVLSTSNADAARDVLKRGKYSFFEGEVLSVHVEDQPGTLARITRKLADGGVNIHGVVVQSRHQGKAELALTVDDLAKARRVLGSG